MIYITRHIDDVTMTFDARKLILTFPHVHSADQPLRAQVPVDVTYNEGWTVEHWRGSGSNGAETAVSS